MVVIELPATKGGIAHVELGYQVVERVFDSVLSISTELNHRLGKERQPQCSKPLQLRLGQRGAILQDGWSWGLRNGVSHRLQSFVKSFVHS